MALHPDITRKDDVSLALETAAGAMLLATRQQTSNAGSVTIPNADGTKTVIGVDAGASGVAPWVGDTTAPGKPTGLSVSSKNAAVLVSWDGSMEGGVPFDWGHLQLLATDDKGNNYDFGVLYGAGSQQIADLTPGVKLTVWAIGYDDAHDAHGNSTPNDSTPSDKPTVTVESAVDPNDVEKAQSDAQTALNQAGQAKSTADTAKQTAQGAQADAKNAVTTANSASSTASTAKSTADSASSVATQANATAVSANQSATSAQTAANLALANAQELVVNGGFETGDATGWSINATYQVVNDMASAHSGRYYLTAGSATEIIQPIPVPVIPGHVYRFSGWYRRPSTNSSIFGGIRFQKSSDGTTYTDWLNTYFGQSEQDDWTYFSIDGTIPPDGSVKYARYRLAFANTTGVVQHFDDLSLKDITEAQAAQKAADDAQATADTANTAAKNATSIANAAQAAAHGAQTTADGKNKIFSDASKPSHTGIVPGDMWFQHDSNKNVNGIKVWNGSAFTDMVLLANELLVASSVGTTQIADNAIVTGKIAANAITAIKIAARTITGDKLDVGSVAAAIVTSGKFQTAASGARVVMDSNGIRAYDAAGNTTFQIEAATGKASLVGGMQTALSGKRISISQSGDTGKVALLNDGSELSSLTFIDDTGHSGYVYTGLYTGQNGQFVQFATLVDSVNHQPDPQVYDASITARGKMLLDASNAINVNGTWFAHDLASLPTAPQVVGEHGTMAFVGGVEYTFDGAGAWVSQTQPAWVVCNTGNSYYTPTAKGSLQALSVRKRSGVVELMGRISVGGTVQQNSDMGAMIPDAYRPTTLTMIQCDQSQWAQLNGPAWYVRPDGHIIWGPYKQNATDATFHGIWTA